MQGRISRKGSSPPHDFDVEAEPLVGMVWQVPGDADKGRYHRASLQQHINQIVLFWPEVAHRPPQLFRIDAACGRGVQIAWASHWKRLSLS